MLFDDSRAELQLAAHLGREECVPVLFVMCSRERRPPGDAWRLDRARDDLPVWVRLRRTGPTTPVSERHDRFDTWPGGERADSVAVHTQYGREVRVVVVRHVDVVRSVLDHHLVLAARGPRFPARQGRERGARRGQGVEVVDDTNLPRPIVGDPR